MFIQRKGQHDAILPKRKLSKMTSARFTWCSPSPWSYFRRYQPFRRFSYPCGMSLFVNYPKEFTCFAFKRSFLAAAQEFYGYRSIRDQMRWSLILRNKSKPWLSRDPHYSNFEIIYKSRSKFWGVRVPTINELLKFVVGSWGGSFVHM